jgi:hypothetical protein
VRGLLAPLAGKNGWTLAEAAGDLTTDGMQRLLNAAAWDADGARDDLRDYAVTHLGERDGVLIVDETEVVRSAMRAAWSVWCALHARGGGPRMLRVTSSDEECSPRAWRWSALGIDGVSVLRVSPRAWRWSRLARSEPIVLPSNSAFPLSGTRNVERRR